MDPSPPIIDTGIDDLHHAQLSVVPEEIQQEINLKIEPALSQELCGPSNIRAFNGDHEQLSGASGELDEERNVIINPVSVPVFSDLTNINDNPFTSYMRKKHQLRRMKEGVILDIHIPKTGQTLEDFIFDYTQRLEENGHGSFTQRQDNKCGNVQYKCERSRKSRRRSAVEDPLKSRANSCGAYVSFLLDAECGKEAFIVRSYFCHSGHDPRDIEERRVSTIDFDLKVYISQLIDEGKKGLEIMKMVSKWSAGHGHSDFRDRRYYPTPNDIKYLVEARKAQTHLDRNDAVSVERMCRTEMQSKIIFYQALNSENKQPLIIVYQNEKQFERMTLYCKDVVFMDASYKGLTAYGFALYCLLARNDIGQGTPVAYFITSEDSENVLATCLTKLKDHTLASGDDFSPRSFMVDKDFKEINALQRVFPNSQVLLCWFHVLQATYRWITKVGSGLTGNDKAEQRLSVIKFMRKLRSCTSIESFDQTMESAADELPNTKVLSYICDQWVPVKDKWCLLGRRFYHGDHDTNNLVERFFLSMKYHFLRGLANRRVDDLLQLLDDDVSSTFDYIDGLIKAGRIKGERMKRDGKKLAETMMSQGWANIIVWHSDDVCYVPSQSSPQESGYLVDIIHATCECQAASQGGMCKHLHLALNLSAAREYDVQTVRSTVAEQLYTSGSWTVDGNFLTVVDREMVGVVNLMNMSCICVASSHGLECVCKMVAEQYKDANSLQSGSLAPSVESNLSLPDFSENARKAKFTQLLGEISHWAENTDSIVTTSMISHIERLHTGIFGQYRKRYTQKKIQPLHPYRSIIEKAKKDHQYHKLKGKKRLAVRTPREGGSFCIKKRKGRTGFLKKLE